MNVRSCARKSPRGRRRYARTSAALLLAASLLLLLLLPAASEARYASRVALTPPMGWNSWDSFGCGVTEQEVKRSADALVASGMRDAGYRYVVVDDCWYAPTRDSRGNLRANASKFPSGMRALSRYLHAHGLLFGIYEAPLERTCAQMVGSYPGSTGSLGHERADARTFASWGVDYLKYDYCSSQGTLHDQIVTFTKMRDALRATGRPIVYSINPNSLHAPTGAAFNWSAIANMVRTSQDLVPWWDTRPLDGVFVGIMNGITIDAPRWSRAGPGHWNDPDMLVVGLQAASFAASEAASGQASAVTLILEQIFGNAQAAPSLEEMRTNFAMWAMMAAPLIEGGDVTRLAPAELKVLLNRDLIAIDQDPLGRQGRPVDPSHQVWAKQLSRGAVATALFNPSSTPAMIATTARRLGLPARPSYFVRDLWTGSQWRTRGPLSADVPAHGVAVFRVTPPAHTRHHRRCARRGPAGRKGCVPQRKK